MSTKSQDNTKSGVAPFLGPGEEVVTSLIASVRGHQQAMAGGVGGAVGGSRASRARQQAAGAGVPMAGVMSFVLTTSRLLVVRVGNAGKVKELLAEIALAQVGPMTVRRRGLGAAVSLEIRGTEIKLESRVGAARAFAEELARARSARA